MLVLLMAFSGAVTAFAADDDAAAVPTDVKGTAYEEAVKALLEQGVVTGYKDGTYRPANTLTRAEACAFLVNYLKPTAEELAAAKDSGFTDVSGWAVSYVNYAVEKGIVAGYKDNTFRPANTVNFQEMATMAVNALGYKADQLTGSWPANYVNKAKELGMYENISVAKANSDAANRGDVAQMVYSLVKYKDADPIKQMEGLLAKSQTATKDLKSMSFDMKMDMAASQNGEKASMSSTMKMDMIMEPMTMHMVMDAVMDGQKQTVDYYYITENNALTMYMNMDGQWSKVVIGDMSGLVSNPTDSMDMYLNGYDTMRIEGKDTVNGKSTTKLYCEISDEYMEKFVSGSGVLDGLQGMTQEEKDLVNQILKSMKGFGYEMWLDDESGMMVKCRIDMTDMMGQVMKGVADTLAKTDAESAAEIAGLSFDKVVMEMTLTNMNSVSEIKLPEAAKDAQAL